MVKNFGKNVFILGIGGISLSGIAEILKAEGHNVIGYDKVRSRVTKKLETDGIRIEENIRKGVLWADTVIYTGAISDDMDELVFARELGKLVLTRAKALAIIASEFKLVVAVAGSHGKTTTTASIATVLDLAHNNFTAHIGGELQRYNQSYLVKGGKEIFLTEACEYKKSFLELAPDIGVILNLDLDHTDTYPTIEALVDGFVQFADNIKSKLVINKDSAYADEVIERTNNKEIITFSISNPSASYYAKINEGEKTFTVYKNGRRLEEFEVKRFGEHNIYNALATVVVADLLGVNKMQTKAGLVGFEGVLRRYEKIGEINGAPVILDYAHHPAEIEHVINEARQNTLGKVYVVFQPHTYTRTKALWSGFIKSLALADSVVLYPIYLARERQLRGVTSERMGEDLRRIKKPCFYSRDLFGIYTYLGYFVSNWDTVLVLGAGDIEKFRECFY